MHLACVVLLLFRRDWSNLPTQTAVLDRSSRVCRPLPIMDVTNEGGEGGLDPTLTMAGQRENREAVSLGVDDYVVPSSVRDSVPLGSVMGNAPTGVYRDPLQYLKMNGVLHTTMRMHGSVDSSMKNIQYNFQSRAADGNVPRAAPGGLIFEDTFHVGEVFQNDITYASTRNAAFPKTFKSMDLSGIAERLARGLTKYALYGTLTAAQLRGGGNINVRAMTAATDNVAVIPGAVFVTRRASDSCFPGAMCALFNAISGEGGTAYTDLLAIDAAGVPQVPNANGATLARGCSEVLRMIGAQMVDSNAGPSFAFAVFCGVNKQMTLAAHTDEGGHSRQVLRRGNYQVPHGAILLGDDSRYTGLPSMGGGMVSARRCVMSILAGGAAGVCNSDPLVTLGGNQYPTSISIMDGLDDDPGVPQPAGAVTDDIRNEMQGAWAQGCGAWARNFSYYLGRLFAAPGDTRSPVRIIGLKAHDMIGVNDNHLRCMVAMCYTWVEPSTITPFWDETLPAMAADCGALTIEGVARYVPTLRDAHLDNHCETRYSSIVFRNGYMRRHGLFVHLTQHARNGMAHLKLYSGTPTQFTNVGGAGAMDARILAGNSLDTFQWGRLHNQVISVGEFMDTNSRLRIICEHFTIRNNAQPWNIRPAHAPDTDELCGKKVAYRVTRPTAEPNASNLVNDNRNWSRSRTGCAKALTLARVRSRVASYNWGAQIRPVLGDPMGASSTVDYDDPASEFLDGSTQRNIVLDDAAVGYEDAGEPSTATAMLPDANGVPVPLVILNVADRGRRGGRGAVAGGGGGAPPIPPAGPGAPPNVPGQPPGPDVRRNSF